MKNNELDLIGQIFGRLTVIGLDHKKQKINKKGIKDGFKYFYKCQCECGNICIIDRNSLRFKRTQSCGCIKNELWLEARTTHNHSKTKLYNVWCGIKRRCYNTHQKSYKDYGAKGIIMCDEWLNDFQTFYYWALGNGYKEGLSIDRINTKGNYEPLNCRWIDKKGQARNKTTNINIEYGGQTKCLSEWATLLGVGRSTLKKRLNNGWGVEKAFTTPVKKGENG